MPNVAHAWIGISLLAAAAAPASPGSRSREPFFVGSPVREAGSVDPRARVEDAAPVTFARAKWRAGDKIASKSVIARSLDYEARIGGNEVEGFEQKDEESIDKTIEVLAVDEGDPTKLRIRYDDYTQKGADDDEESEESPLDELTIVLERRDGEVVVRDEDGDALDDEVEKLVREEEVTADGRFEAIVDRVADLVAEKPRKIGDALEVPEEIAIEIFAKQGETKKASIRFELLETREIEGVACGVFRTKIEVSGTDDDVEYETDLEGETWIAVESGRYQGSKLTGRLVVHGEVPTEAGEVELRGEGTLEVEQTRAYEHE